MSDRRERVARALAHADAMDGHNLYSPTAKYAGVELAWSDMPDHDHEDGCGAYLLGRDSYRLRADAALAALDAEPTEAEIGAACPECGGHGRGCSFCGGTGDWPRTSEPTADEIIAAADAIEEICPSLRDAYPDGPSYTAPVVLAKAALIAARKARP